MKKLIISNLLFVCFSATTEAQNNAAPSAPSTSRDSRDRIHLGIKAGLNNANIYDSQGEEFSAKSKVGFVGGAYLSVPIGKFIGIRPEVLFSQKGFLGRGTFEGAGYNLSRTTSYIDVPILVEFKPIKFLTIVGGPQYSYLVAQTDIFTNGNITTVQEQEFANDNVRKNVFGAAFGFDINVGRFVIGVRDAFDLQKNNGDGTSSAPRYKNAWLQGTIGFRL